MLKHTTILCAITLAGCGQVKETKSSPNAESPANNQSGHTTDDDYNLSTVQMSDLIRANGHLKKHLATADAALREAAIACEKAISTRQKIISALDVVSSDASPLQAKLNQYRYGLLNAESDADERYDRLAKLMAELDATKTLLRINSPQGLKAKYREVIDRLDKNIMAATFTAQDVNKRLEAILFDGVFDKETYEKLDRGRSEAKMVISKLTRERERLETLRYIPNQLTTEELKASEQQQQAALRDQSPKLREELAAIHAEKAKIMTVIQEIQADIKRNEKAHQIIPGEIPQLCYRVTSIHSARSTPALTRPVPVPVTP